MSNTVGMASNPGTGYTIVTHVLPPSNITEQGVTPAGPLWKFLKGEPKALGTVQIMLGVVMLLFGIVFTAFCDCPISVYSGITIWGALMYVATGAVSVAASNKLNRCLVRGSLVMNVLNAVTAGIAIITFSIELSIASRRQYYTCSHHHHYRLRGFPDGIIGVLLVLSILQFFISISVSVFGCKAVCNNEPLVNINLVPNTGGCCSVVNPVPAQNNEQWMYTAGADSVSIPPKESPPEYSLPETNGQMCN